MNSGMFGGGNKPNVIRAKVHSAETTVTILKGSPVFYKITSTAANDGIDVISAEGLADVNQGFFAGIAMQDIAPGKYREAQVFGICEYARLILTTRSATSATWASQAAGAIGDIMSIATGTNLCQALSDAATGVAGTFPKFALGTSWASITTQASSLGPTGTAWTTTGRIFMRAL